MSEYKSYQRQEDDEIEIDLRQILVVLRKWSKLIISMSLLCMIAAGLLSYFILAPVYQASTLLMVTQATDKLTTNPVAQGEGLDNVVDSVSRTPVLTMNTYLGQLKSEALMERVIKRLHLDPLQYSPAGLAGLIEASIVKDSNLIEVKVNNGDPATASQIANTLSEQYLQLMTDKNQEQLSRSVTFLDKQKKITDEQLRKAEKALEELQSQPRGVAVLETEFLKKSEDAVNYESRFKMVQVEIRQTSAGVNQLQMKLDSIPNMIPVEKWTDSGSISTQEVNPLYLSTAQQLSEKQAALAEKEGESAGLADLFSSMQMDLDSLQAELASKRLAQDKIQREVDRLKLTSETLAKKGTETQIAKSIDLGDTSVMVLSEASIPISPIKPNKKLNMAIAFILGLMLFTLLAFILEYLDNTIKTPEDISRELALPVLGVIPKANSLNTQQQTYGG